MRLTSRFTRSETAGRARRSGAVAWLTVALAASLAACAGPGENDVLGAADLPFKARQPLPAGKARIVMQRTGDAMYSGVAATVKLNDQKVADIWAGQNAVVDVAPGKALLAVEAWSYPGVYRLEIDARAGALYRVAIAPRGASFGPSAILGPFGGLIDKDEAGNSGAFMLELGGAGAKAKPQAKPPAPRPSKG